MSVGTRWRVGTSPLLQARRSQCWPSGDWKIPTLPAVTKKPTLPLGVKQGHMDTESLSWVTGEWPPPPTEAVWVAAKAAALNKIGIS